MMRSAEEDAAAQALRTAMWLAFRLRFTRVVIASPSLLSSLPPEFELYSFLPAEFLLY
jgi:hypothetical protein